MVHRPGPRPGRRQTLRKARPPLAAALVFLLVPAPSQANPSLASDFGLMTQWLSHELAQGMAFSAGSNFDPPKEVKGYYLQPDISFGAGRMPLDKRNFPDIQVQALKDYGGAGIFPNSVTFPNLALHLRMGLPWHGDLYFRFADATTPSGYKISPTISAQVQTNSYGAGVRQHFFGGDLPALTLGAHYNHVRGRTHLKGKVHTVNANVTADADLVGDINWNVNSFGFTAVTHYSFGSLTPFAGFGYNYATGSVRTRLVLQPNTWVINNGDDIVGEGSEHPESSQGRWIGGLQYERPTWSIFGNAEIKALGQLQYRSVIAQVGVALPFDIGRGPAVFYKKRKTAPSAPQSAVEDEPAPAPKTRRRVSPPPSEQTPSSEVIFLR